MFVIIRHLLEIWFAGFMVKPIRGQIALIKLPGGMVALVPFEVDTGEVTREIFIEQVYDKFYYLRGDDVVVDVGAHVGLFTLKVARTAMLVIAVEPHPLNYKLLTLNIDINKLKNVIPVKLALSDRTGKAILYLGSSSGHTLKGEYSKLKNGKKLDVDVKTLDYLISELGLDRVTFIKLDVEGAELDVLRGSEKVLTKNDWLFLAIAAYHYPGEVLEVARFLKMRGFELFSNGKYIYAFKPAMRSRIYFN